MRRITKRLLLRCWGIGSVISSITSTLVILLDIYVNGYCRLAEPNRIILTIEVISTVYAMAYYLYREFKSS